MTDEKKMTLEKFHKKFAVETNNGIWPILDKEKPTDDELEEALHMAHTSMFHWSKIGKPINKARAEYMISRVCSAMGRGEAALFHAKKCLKITEETGIGDWDLAFAYEAIARAHGVASDTKNCRKFKETAQKAIDDIKGEEDKKICQGELDKVSC
jgi:hypothetical protein